jgi:hypothetical protein
MAQMRLEHFVRELVAFRRSACAHLAGAVKQCFAAPEHFTFETLHSAWSVKIHFAYASCARPTLTLSAVRAISK